MSFFFFFPALCVARFLPLLCSVALLDGLVRMLDSLPSHRLPSCVRIFVVIGGLVRVARWLQPAVALRAHVVLAVRMCHWP